MGRRLLALAALALGAPVAHANGDPASDVLLQTRIYFPTQRVSVDEAKKLHDIVDSANAKGYAIRVALIRDQTDLGVVPNLLNQPQKYAEFLGPEIRFAYKGDLLVEDRYAEWTEGPRQELRDLHNDLLIELSQLYAAAGKLELAAERLERLLQADPLNEDANRLMMRVYAEVGSRQKAHRQYKSFRAALRREIGAAPSEETETLIRDILAGKVDRTGP